MSQRERNKFMHLPRSNVYQLSPIEQGVESFRRILHYKTRMAFRDWPVNEQERWEIISTQTSWAFGMLVEVAAINGEELLILGSIIHDAYEANRQNDMQSVVESINRYFSVFERKARAA
jgi:hypothetical protein